MYCIHPLSLLVSSMAIQKVIPFGADRVNRIVLVPLDGLIGMWWLPDEIVLKRDDFIDV